MTSALLLYFMNEEIGILDNYYGSTPEESMGYLGNYVFNQF